ncbi:class I SAM-dependent methyltransferase [Streptomyces netropsis]
MAKGPRDDTAEEAERVAGRILDLLRTPPAKPDFRAGYLDLLGQHTGPTPGIIQQAMQSRILPHIYERLWRPAWFNFAKGWPLGPDTTQEEALARAWLGLAQPSDRHKPAATVLDVACGPGNLTRALATGIARRVTEPHRAEGLVVGIDISPNMLAHAVRATAQPRQPPHAPSPARENDAPDIGYVRGDASALPFRDSTFDAVCCFGALYLIPAPWAALDNMVRVLKPGGRLAILTTRRPANAAVRLTTELASRTVGIRMFDQEELTQALTDHGLDQLRQRNLPILQLVAGRRA